MSSFALTSSKDCWICLLAFEFCSFRTLRFFSTSFFLIKRFSMLLSILSKVVYSSLLMIGWDFLIVLTSWSLCLPGISKKLPWMTHYGQIHSHLQVKQKYIMSSSICYPHVFLLEIPAIRLLATPELPTYRETARYWESSALILTDSVALPIVLWGVGTGMNF